MVLYSPSPQPCSPLIRGSLHLSCGGLHIKPAPVLGFSQTVWTLHKALVPPLCSSCSSQRPSTVLLSIMKPSVITPACGVSFFSLRPIDSCRRCSLFGAKSSTVIWHSFGARIPRSESLSLYLLVSCEIWSSLSLLISAMGLLILFHRVVVLISEIIYGKHLKYMANLYK